MRTDGKSRRGGGRGGTGPLVDYLEDEPKPSNARRRRRRVHEPVGPGELQRFLGFRTRNLPSGLSLEAAAGVMDSVLRLNRGAADDVLHLTLTPHPEERLIDPATWDQIWTVYAGELGLLGNFCVMVRHGDGHKDFRQQNDWPHALVHEHGIIPLVHPTTFRRMPITDIVQRLEIGDGYVESRWGLCRSRDRNIRMTAEQRQRLEMLRELGAQHREMDARGEPVALPTPPDLARQRRNDRKRRYEADKSVAFEVRHRLSTLERDPATWGDLEEELAHRGLEYRVDYYRPSNPPQLSGRFYLVDGPPPAEGVAGSSVAPKWKLDRLISSLGPCEPGPERQDCLGQRHRRRRSIRGSTLPPPQPPTSIEHAITLLAEAKLSYEVRPQRTKRGRQTFIGYLKDARNGKLRRATGSWSLSRLIRCFGAGTVQVLQHRMLAPPPDDTRSGLDEPAPSASTGDPPPNLEPGSKAATKHATASPSMVPASKLAVVDVDLDEGTTSPTVAPTSTSHRSRSTGVTPSPRASASTAPAQVAKPHHFDARAGTLGSQKVEVPETPPGTARPKDPAPAQPEGSARKSPSFSM